MRLKQYKETVTIILDSDNEDIEITDDQEGFFMGRPKGSKKKPLKDLPMFTIFEENNLDQIMAIYGPKRWAHKALKSLYSVKTYNDVKIARKKNWAIRSFTLPRNNAVVAFFFNMFQH